jgi:hypothetical protein
MLRFSTYPRGIPVAGFAALLGALVGCGGGGNTATVSGAVSLDNGPLTGGKITFVTATEHRGTKEFSGMIDRQGQYTVSDVPLGSVKVKIETAHLNPKGFGGVGDPSKMFPKGDIGSIPKEFQGKMKDHVGDLAKAKEAQKDAAAKMVVYKWIPAKYTNPATSGLTAEITERTQTGVNFALVSKK